MNNLIENTPKITPGDYALPANISFVDGGVCAPAGFKAAGVHAGFRKNATRLDMALVVADAPCASAATFTQNVFCAAPVLFDKRQYETSSGSPSYGQMRAIVINSGNANAATGDLGLQAARKSAELTADAIGCPASEVLVASTGVIGVQLPISPFESGLPLATSALSDNGGHDAACAIMTTDTYSKECAVSIDGALLGYPEKTFHIGAMAKGSGMIMPNMATMISVITTDVPIKADTLYAALKDSVDVSFNKVTVDSDTSTNDSCFAMSSGLSLDKDASPLVLNTPEYDAFKCALDAVCINLARQMARDGEGATKLVNVFVRGAASEVDADLAARTIANSPLVKTAIAGRDANWGRIAAALGRSGASFKQADVDISIMGIAVCQSGLALDFDEDDALKKFEDDEIIIEVDLHAGNYSTCIWTCDLTHDYISINADYRS